MISVLRVGSRSRPGLRYRLQEALIGWAFILPAVLGLLFFQLGPVLASLYFSFTNYDIVTPPKWVGLTNYVRLFTADRLYIKSLTVTAYYSALAIPLSLVVAYLVALLMNQRVRGISLYRTLWYLPSLVPATANGVLWLWLLNRDFGPVNFFLRLAGLPAPAWLSDPNWTVPALVLVHLWGVGNAVLIFLAGLQGVPQHLYEAAEVDGATWWHKFRHVTLPMTSSIIFFNLVMGIIGTFQVFSIVYIIFTPPATEIGTAGPENAALVYVLYLYRNAFQYFKMGYASAMAWVLLLIILTLTLLVFRSQGRWVYYEAVRR
jgi:multiple sugar transport system permease protein